MSRAPLDRAVSIEYTCRDGVAILSDRNRRRLRSNGRPGLGPDSPGILDIDGRISGQTRDGHVYLTGSKRVLSEMPAGDVVTVRGADGSKLFAAGGTALLRPAVSR